MGAVRAGSVVVATAVRGLASAQAAQAVATKATDALAGALQRAGLGRAAVSPPQVAASAPKPAM